MLVQVREREALPRLNSLNEQCRQYETQYGPLGPLPQTLSPEFTESLKLLGLESVPPPRDGRCPRLVFDHLTEAGTIVIQVVSCPQSMAETW